MDKLLRLMSLCKCGVYVSINEHRDNYMSIYEHIENLKLLDDLEETQEKIIKKIIETDTIINVYFYPETPVGSYSIYHYDLDGALNEALNCLNYK